MNPTHTGPFRPLPDIIYADDFDCGLQGWTGLIGNYEHSLDSILPEYRDLRPPMLSNATTWDTGTGGSATGTYSMKLATRAKSRSLAVGVKRTTYPVACPLQLEMLFTFKPEASQLRLSLADVGAVGIIFDLQDAQRRVMPHLRYLNAINGELAGRWQFKQRSPTFHDIGDSGDTVSHFHLGPDGWQDLPGGDQRLCYNEISTKQNWHYLRVGFDLATMSFTALQCNDRHFDVSTLEPMTMPAMPNLWCMLNVVLFAEASADRRAFFYADSVLLSADFDAAKKDGR